MTLFSYNYTVFIGLLVADDTTFCRTLVKVRLLPSSTAVNIFRDYREAKDCNFLLSPPKLQAP